MPPKSRKNLEEELLRKCQSVFEGIVSSVITDQIIAKAFRNLVEKGLNPSDIKNALGRAGDLERVMPRDRYTRQDLLNGFEWGERALQENLKKWRLNHLSKTYKKEEIQDAAEKAGWEMDRDIEGGTGDRWTKKAKKRTKEITTKEFFQD